MRLQPAKKKRSKSDFKASRELICVIRWLLDANLAVLAISAEGLSGMSKQPCCAWLFHCKDSCPVVPFEENFDGRESSFAKKVQVLLR